MPGASQFAVVSVTTQPRFTVGNPVSLPTRFVENGPGSPSSIDITPDGKRFVGVVRAGQSQASDAGTPPSLIQVVLNRVEELKQKAPTP